MAKRRRCLNDVIANHRETSGIESILDYGGDRGQMMIGGPGREKCVFDLSGVEPEPGVQGMTALGGLTFDLILLCCIVEHVSEPVELLIEIAEHLTAKQGFVYIQVPDEQFKLSNIPKAKWYCKYLGKLIRCRILLTLVDFYSTVFRVKWRIIPPLGFVKAHEHLNYFNKESLQRLIERAGYDILECNLRLDIGALIALARKKRPSQTP